MGNVRKSKLLLVHTILMALLGIMSIASAVIVFTGNIPEGFEAGKETFKTTAALYGAAHVVNAVALACGITYTMKGSGKAAAKWYKALVLLVALSITLRLIGTLIYPGFNVNACLMIVSIIILLILCFVKDLGDQKTWILFHVLLAVEIALAIITFDKREVMSSIAGNLSRLMLVGTIGLAIREKYQDKARRKTK